MTSCSCGNTNSNELMYTMGGQIVCTKCFPEVKNPRLVKDTETLTFTNDELERFANWLEAKKNGQMVN